MNRYFPIVLELVKAHALLHQLSREPDPRGCVVATIDDDYAAVYELVNDIISVGLGALVPSQQRQLHQAITSITGGGDPAKARPGMSMGVPQKVIAEKMQQDKGNISRWVKRARELGLLPERSDPRGREDFVYVNEPLPEDRKVLPTPEELKAAYAAATARKED
jgi:hypothetical protein